MDATHTITLSVGGNDVTDYLQRGAVAVTDTLTSELDTCSFTLFDTDGAMPAIANWDEVLVEEGATKHFAGYLVDTTLRSEKGVLKTWDCKCEDYGALLGSVAVNAKYENTADDAIIAAIFASLVANEGFDATTHVSQSGTISYIRFNRTSVLAAMRELCDITGYDWYVDSAKALWYFDPAAGAANAPFDLADAVQADYAATYPMDSGSFQIKGDAHDIRNRVYVYGGKYEAPAMTQYWDGDGIKQEFWTAYEPQTVNWVTVDGVAQTTGVDFVDDPNAYDCLINYHRGALRFYQAAPGVGTNNVACNYTYYAPIAIVRTNAASRAAFGRYYDDTIVDPKIRTVDAATAAADAVLAEYATERVTAKASVHRAGLRSGQLIQVWDSVTGISGTEYLIQQVKKEFHPSGLIICTLTLGEYRHNIIELLLKVAGRQADYVPEERGETMRLIISLTAEDADVAETAPSWDLLTDYYWAAAAGAHKEGYWDRAVWA